MMLRLFLLATALPIALTVALHQVVPGMAVPMTATPLAIGPMEHVNRTVIFGVDGPAGLMLMGATLAVIIVTLREATGGLRRLDALALGLFTGGAISNGGESFVRNSVIDWLWLSPDGEWAMVVNSADLALTTGGAFMALRVAAIAAGRVPLDTR